jgi:hypothetical protein
MALRNLFNAAAPPNPPQCGGTAPLRRTARVTMRMRIRLDRTLGADSAGARVGASVSHPVPRLGSGFELRRRVMGAVSAGRREGGAGRLVDRGPWGVPSGWRVGRLPRPPGGGLAA